MKVSAKTKHNEKNDTFLDCRHTYHYYDERKSFCAEPPVAKRKDKFHTCVGDAGSPLVMLEEETPVLVGLASWGHGCPVGRPRGIYVNVGNFIRSPLFCKHYGF